MTLNAVGVGHRHDSTFYIKRPGGSGDWLLLILKTPALFTLNGRECEAESGSVMLFSRGSPQVYRALGGDFCNDWLHMDFDEDDERLVDRLCIPVDIPVKVGDSSRLSGLLTEIHREAFSGSSLAADNINLHFRLMMNRFREDLDAVNRGSSTHRHRLLELRSEIYRNPSENWSVNRVCASLGLSRSTVQHLYRDCFGTSLTDDIISSRIERAKRFLETTDIPVWRVAELCGYANDIHFMRQFKKRCGITPLRHRRAKGGNA